MGGELAPKVVLGKLGLLTPKWIFYKNLCSEGSDPGTPKDSKFPPPLILGDLTPPIPVSNNKKRTCFAVLEILLEYSSGR